MTARKAAKPLGSGMMLPGLVAEQRRMLERRNHAPEQTAQRVTNSSTRGIYKGEATDQSSMRPGANDFLRIPSRFNDALSYRKDSGVVL